MEDIFLEALWMELRIVNIYRPFHNHVEFWESLLHSLLLMEYNIILQGDLNFSMEHVESLGNHAQIENLLGFFINMQETNNVIDILILQIKPTWRNHKIWDDMLARRLE